MEDYEAQAQAWIRKKPRRIIHNQVLIQLLFVEAVIGSFLIVWFYFWLWSVVPLTGALTFGLWIVAATGYCVLAMLRRRNEKRLYK
jgi:hypothetical protein